MTKVTILALALAALAAVPAQAQDEALGCMDLAYDKAELGEIGQLAPQVRFDGGVNNAAAERVGEIALRAVFACSGQYGWNEPQTTQAMYYEMGRLYELAYRSTGLLSDEQLERIDTALAAGNRDAVWAAIERGVVAGMTGEASSGGRQDDFILGGFVIGAGLGSDEATGERIGVLLGFMALQRMGARDFAAAGHGK